MVEVPFLSSAEIKVSISLVRQGSTVKAWYLVLRSSLYSGKHYSIGSFTGWCVSMRGLDGKPLKRCLWFAWKKKKQIKTKMKQKNNWLSFKWLSTRNYHLILRQTATGKGVICWGQLFMKRYENFHSLLKVSQFPILFFKKHVVENDLQSAVLILS